MDANDNCGFAIFKWMVTIISFTIALPCYFHTGTKVAFVLKLFHLLFFCLCNYYPLRIQSLPSELLH